MVLDGLGSLPKEKRGAAKYTGFSNYNVGMYSVNSFPKLDTLSQAMKQVLICSANNGLAKSSWSSYKTVERHLVRAQQKSGVRMVFPMNKEMVLAFIAYLLECRKIKSKSVNQYLSGLRTLHLVRGHEVPMLRPGIVEAILKGRANFDEEISRHDYKNKRLPVTIEVMKMINILVKKQGWLSGRVACIEAVTRLAFSGGFR